MDAMLDQIVDLGLGLDPFGDHLHVRLEAEGDDGFQQVALGIVRAYGVDEHLVDLDLADAEALQVGEAAVAGAEIVQLEVIPLLLQGGDLPHGRLDVGDGLTLRELEGEPVRRGPAMALQLAAQMGLLYVGGHQVDTDPLGRRQTGEIGDDLLQQLIRHGQDQVLLFRIGDEGAWRHHVPPPLPAQQGLEADHLPGAAVHHGLVEGDELPPCQPGLQQPLEGVPVVAQPPVDGHQQTPQGTAIPEAVVASLHACMVLQRLARPQGLPDLLAGIQEAQALAGGFLLDGAVPARKDGIHLAGFQLAELEIETVGTRGFQQVMAPAVAQHPVGDIAAGPVVGNQLLLGVEAGLGGDDPELIASGVGGHVGGVEGQRLSQAGAAAAGGENEPLYSKMLAVKMGTAQQRHVLGAAIETKASQLEANALIQFAVAFEQRLFYLPAFQYQQLAGEGALQQVPEGQGQQRWQAEQQQTDPERGCSSQEIPVRWTHGMQMDCNIIALAASI